MQKLVLSMKLPWPRISDITSSSKYDEDLVTSKIKDPRNTHTSWDASYTGDRVDE